LQLPIPQGFLFPA